MNTLSSFKFEEVESDKIPKKLHYCWFGKGEKSQAILDCIASWKKFMPDYEIIEWNEDNFNININEYVKDAYEQKKWAFVSDYARLYALYNVGGVYLDTDVEVFKPFDIFLDNKMFTGFENVGYPVTAVMGARKNHPIIKEMLDHYIGKKFDWKPFPHMETNTMIMSDILAVKGIDRYKNELQRTPLITVYPKVVLCPIIPDGITDETYAIHKMFGSWG